MRSYKKQGCFSDCSKKRTPFMKKIANKKVRKSEIGDFSEYKKIFESYTIFDYKFIDFENTYPKSKRK